MAADIETRIAEWLAAQPGFDAFEVADLRIQRHGKRSVVQILLERVSGQITLGECSLWNRALSNHLEQADLFTGPYVVEIASPGADRLLTRRKDFERILGRKLKVRYQDAAGTIRECTGLLERADETGIGLRSEKEALELPYDRIQQARQEITFSKGNDRT